MALSSDEVCTSKNDEVNLPSSNNQLSMEYEEVEHMDTPLSAITDEEQNQPLSSTSIESEEKTSNIDEINKGNFDKKRQDRLKTRSVSFAPTVEEFEIPSSRYSPFSSSHEPTDYIDALVESYKLQTLTTLFPYEEEEEKKYVFKTSRTRLNPNWREHRIRHLMNKLEELTLWDREQELKATQAQFLREQKLEQIQDRQRNHDLCLNLMRQRHESELESAILLDQGVNSIKHDNTNAIIAQTMNLASSSNILPYNLPTPPHVLKRRVRQEQEQLANIKTPIGRYRQFETTMNNKVEKINQKLKPDWEIMRAYNPYRTSLPPTFVPLFSETYAALLSIPHTYSSNRYNRHHYGMSSYSQQSSQHASSPDYDTRLRSHSNRDVRVPLKEQINDNSDDDDDYYNSRLSSNPSKRSPNLASNTSREYSLIHSPQPLSNKIHQRTLNDDLNAITQFSFETSKKILQDITNSSNDISTKTRSSSVPINKRVTFIDHSDRNEENFNYN